MKNYNIIPIDISTEIKSLPIGTSGGYIALISAPTNANVRIQINSKDADEIPLKAYHAIQARGVEEIFLSADAVPGAIIKIVQAPNSNEFKMITPASDINIENISSYTPYALAQMDKIINPYQQPIFSNSSTTNIVMTTLLNKTLTCDKIKINTHEGYKISTGECQVDIIIDGKRVLGGKSYTYNTETPNRYIELEGIRGLNLLIQGFNSSGFEHGYALQEYTLK